MLIIDLRIILGNSIAFNFPKQNPSLSNFYMKSPHSRFEQNLQQRSVDIGGKYPKVDSSKANSLFQQQSPSYRSKSIDQKVSQLNDTIIATAVKQKDYRRAISLLHQLENYIHNQDNQTSRTNKLLFYFELSICYYNHAVVYQRVQNDEETAKYFQKALKNLEYMQGYITCRQEGVSYSIEVAKLQIQYCSILSQTGKHEEAITYAQKALQKLIQCFRILEAICFEFVMENRLPQTNNNSRDSRTKIQLVNFKKFVLLQAEKMLKELSTLPEPHELPNKFKKKYDSLMQKMFFWKTNQQNNQKQLRKQLMTERKQVNSERNILGVQKNSFLNQNLTLESLTNLQIKSINYSFNNDPFFLLSCPKITEMAFYVSMIYFMIATQIRFSQVDLNVNKLKIDQKYKKLNRDERMTKCKMIHMKAIEIAGKFLPEKNEFFSHILNRFNKNYKCVMEEINEQSKEQSIKQIEALQSQKLIQPQKQVLPEEQYGIQNKNQSLINSLSFKQHQQDILISSASPSLKKFKKNYTLLSSQDQTQRPKRKLSSSKQKQNYNFQYHKRSTSHNNTRTTSQHQNRDRSSSAKMIASCNSENRQRLKTISNSVRKPIIEKGFKKMKTKPYEGAFDKVKFTQIQNLMQVKENFYDQKKHQPKQFTQKSKDKEKRTILLSPTVKRKLSSCKIQLKSEGMTSPENKLKKFHFQRKHN